MGKNVTIYFNDSELEKLIRLEKKHSSFERGSLIKHILFGRRQRNKVKLETLDLVLLSELDNLVEAALYDLRKGHDVMLLVKELKKKLQQRLPE